MEGTSDTGVILTNHMRAVILVVALTLRALETCPYLCADPDPVAHVDRLHLGSNPDRAANDFVSHTDGKRHFAPAAVDRVHVRAAHAATFDGNVNVMVRKRFRFELNDVLLVTSWFADEVWTGSR